MATFSLFRLFGDSNAMPNQNNEVDAGDRERLLRVLAGATFIIFFQAYMVAPILPALSQAFETPERTVGLVVPAYLIPYGMATLIYGLLADRLGIHRVMFVSMAAFSVLTALTASSTQVAQLAMWRIATGIGAGGVVPLALVLVGRLFPYEERGRPLGWLFGAMAGGMAFGSPLGALLTPVFGWRGLFLGVGAAGIGVLLLLLTYRRAIAAATQPMNMHLGDVLRGYKDLFATRRARRTYGYVLINSMFHSGVFTWLASYLERRYHLSPAHVGLALLGYGVPGFLLGPVIGRLADRWGRARLIPLGLLLSAASAAALVTPFPVLVAPIIAMTLSLGYDMTQPLFGGIVTSLGGKRPGQAMGMNVFTLFVGFGLGSLAFGAMLQYGFGISLGIFSAIELVAAVCSLRLFQSESPKGIGIRPPATP
ncbi:MFS transporter [Paraburkholderia sp. BCC1884]|uniref:MFS transporter n=1 Tax=Paraburkholderia sp. BCC1884 TaxID=2562668 RepID=UPI0021B16022|nr:MFS transporter [Paraburkholderia sp. BCC1884]